MTSRTNFNSSFYSISNDIGEPDSQKDEFLQSDASCSSLVDFETIITDIGVGNFQRKLLLLSGGGFFAMCAELLVFVFSTDPVQTLWGIDNIQYAWLPFSKAVASIIGCFIGGKFSDEYGRRWPFIIGIGICCVFGIASAFSPSFWSFVLLRSIVSIGIGMLFSVDFTILIEFLPKKHRGAYMILVTLSGTLGVLYVSGIAWLLLPRGDWRIFIGMASAPACIVFIGRLCFNVESPKYYLTSGQYGKAIDVLNRVAADNHVEEVLRGKYVFYEPEPNRGQVFSLFAKQYRLRTIHLTLVWFLHTFGYWGVTVYLPQYLKRYDLNPYMVTFITIGSELPGILLAMYLVDKAILGRLKTWMLFLTGSILSLLGLVIADRWSSILPLLTCLSYFFIVPIFAIMQLYTPEVYPTWLRSTAMAFVNFSNSIPEMITAFVSANLLDYEDKRLYPLLWAGILFLEALVLFTMRKETVLLKLDADEEEGGNYFHPPNENA